MTRKAIREQVVTLLRQPDFAALVELAGKMNGLPELLLRFCYDPTDLLTWRAIEGLGHLAAAYPDQVKKIINRLLYLLNEDSGSTGWGAAAALGEIGRHNLPLVRDIIPMFCGYLENKFSRSTMLWGIARLAEVHPQVLEETIPFILPCLDDPNPTVQALSARCLGLLKVSAAREPLTALQNNPQTVQIYDQCRINRTTVGQVAKEALGVLEGA